MTDALTKEAFAEWLEQSPLTRFDLGNANNCALTQYARSIGHDGSTSGFHIKTSASGLLEIPGLFEAMQTLKVNDVRTFGALARRLRAA